MNIWITRPDQRGEALAQQLNAQGIFALHQPLFEIEAGRELTQLSAYLAKLNEGDYVFAVSQNAVTFASQPLAHTGHRFRRDLHYFAVGHQTARALSEQTEQVVRYPTQNENSEGVLALPEMQDLQGKNLLILRAETGRELLREQAQLRGAKVQTVECYRRQFFTDLSEKISFCKRAGIDGIVITSGEILSQLYQQTAEADRAWLMQCQLVVVGDRLAQQALSLGWQPHQILRSPKADNDSLLAILNPSTKKEEAMTKQKKSSPHRGQAENVSAETTAFTAKEEKVAPSVTATEPQADIQSTPQTHPAENVELTISAPQEEPSMTASEENIPTPAPAKSSGGKGLAFLALLVALGVGGAGYYFGTEKLNNLTQQIAQLDKNSTPSAVEFPNFEAEKAQLADLTSKYQQALNQIEQLQTAQQGYRQQIDSLQSQLSQLDGNKNADTTQALLITDGELLIKNALRKLSLEKDSASAVALLSEADKVLSGVNTEQANRLKTAIQADIASLKQVSNLNQSELMQGLSQLTTSIDGLPVLTANAQLDTNSGEVSDSLDDWQQNLEKSANSFLDRFIRVSDRNKTEEKAFIAPNQEIYLRENIRLRLQIAMLAVSRGDNALYQSSLETVSNWVRSYFDTTAKSVKDFLQVLDPLMTKSVTVDLPNSLQSASLVQNTPAKQPLTVETPKVESTESKAEPSKSSE